MFLKVSWSLQESICAEMSFYSCMPAALFNSDTGIFPSIVRSF